jgi:hypothetical protein
VTMWGESSWQLDWRQSGRVGEETWDTLQVLAGLSVDILTLDIVGVVVVPTVEVVAEILVFQRVSMSWMTMSSGFELVKFVSHVGRIVYKSTQVEGHQSDWR